MAFQILLVYNAHHPLPLVMEFLVLQHLKGCIPISAVSLGDLYFNITNISVIGIGLFYTDFPADEYKIAYLMSMLHFINLCVIHNTLYFGIPFFKISSHLYYFQNNFKALIYHLLHRLCTNIVFLCVLGTMCQCPLS